MQGYQQNYFLGFLYLMMLNHTVYFFYLCKYDILFIFERLSYKQFKIKLYFRKNFFFLEGN